MITGKNRWQVTTIMVAALVALAMVAANGGCGKKDNPASPGITDNAPPTVRSTYPANNATGVFLNRIISASFSEALDPATVIPATFTLMNGATPVTGTVSYAATGATASFTPAGNLDAGTVYKATLTTGIKDASGNAMAGNYVWSFTTGTTADVTPPTVLSTDPADNETSVAINRNIVATFDEGMDATTLTTSTFALTRGGSFIPGTVTCTGTVATFNPGSDLAASTLYTATISTGAKDLSGNALAAAKTWSFTTGTTAAAGPAPVNLGTAGNYVILAKSAVSTTGATAVVGNIGLSPAAASYITGFGLIMDPSNTFSTSSLVTGSVYAADYTEPTPTILTTAVSDMETAYTDAAGRTLPDHTELGAGDITSMTLAPGLYKWGTGVLISSAGVTLSGNTNDVWIFQIAQTLTVGSGAIVTLSGGAQAKNVFWQVAGQATLGTTSQFKGIILCQTLIEMQTGATLNGRALAQTAVTLDANSVSVP